MRIRLAGLSKEFVSARGSTFAANGIDLEIREGELFVLLGPSGCGKSTVLNLIAGLEKPTGGEILFGDRVVAGPDRRIFVPPGERNVAMVFQSYALYPHLSVFGNIAFPLEIARKNRAEIREAVAGVAEMLGISELLSARPGELSGGQRQRVAIARALVRRPSVFLMDEPLSNLDAMLRASTRTELKNLQRRLGVTTVYVTHDQVEAMSLGDRIAVLRGGAVEQVGKPEELYDAPVNTFVASFIASPPMNLLKIELAEEGGRRLIRVDGEDLVPPGSAAALLGGLDAGKWILGLRPEHIRLSADAAEQGGRRMVASGTGAPAGGSAAAGNGVTGFGCTADTAGKSSGGAAAEKGDRGSAMEKGSRDTEDSRVSGTVIHKEVHLVEPMGRDVLLHFTIGAQKLLVLTADRSFAQARPGDSLVLELDLTRAHLFAPNGVKVRNVR